jgi:hypothetical protein
MMNYALRRLSNPVAEVLVRVLPVCGPEDLIEPDDEHRVVRDAFA